MKLWSTDFHLTASEVDAQLRMPLSSLVVAIIDAATGHANRIGVGYNDMMKTNSSWVLSRLAIDIADMPRLNGDYRLSTWITGINRLFSDRCFELTDLSSGHPVVSAHSVWMAIDMDTRRPADLTALNVMTDRINPRQCSCVAAGKLRPVPQEEVVLSYDYRVKVSDIDVNRHLTTRRYIDLLVDLHDLEFYGSHTVSRFEIAFKKESRYDELLTASASSSASTGICEAQIADGDTPHALARMIFSPVDKHN